MSDHPTHRGPHEAPAVESDACIAFRGRLSAYLDGMLADEAREAADAHAAVCEACRHRADTLEAAESNLARIIDDEASAPLPPGFTGAILARTVHESASPDRRNAGPAGLAPWLGWIAAAAMLVFTVTARNVESPGGPRTAESAGEPAPTVVSAAWQVSATRSDRPVGLDGLHGGDQAIDAISALDAAATLLDTLATDTGDPEAVARFAARVIAYDELLPRLDRLDRDLSPESSAVVEVARGLLEDLLGGDPGAVDRVVRQIGDGSLAAALRRVEWRLGGGSV